MTWQGSSRKQRQRHAGISGWQEQRDARRILERDGHRCYRCGGPAAQVDHLRPLAHGGTHTDNNLAAICAACHLAKSQAELRRFSERQRAERHPGLTPGGGPPPRGASG